MYKSKYTEKEVTAAQLITEKMCEKIANNKKEVLLKQFWFNPKWAKTFGRQILIANKLLKIYSEEAIIKAMNRALQSNDWMFSLTNETIERWIEEEEGKLTFVKSIKNDLKVSDKIEAPRESNKKGILDKLDG